MEADGVAITVNTALLANLKLTAVLKGKIDRVRLPDPAAQCLQRSLQYIPSELAFMMPAIAMSVVVMVSCRFEHRPFFSIVHQVMYKKLDQTSHVEALIYHVQHLPFSLTLGSSTFHLGEALSLQLGCPPDDCGQSNSSHLA